ncbi:hypothetical protein CGLO_08812 [Colletotrichum gloeosporioides Cg-14]|uniref:Uncharacterized protein n=1 Tax=Colletotrichum gloeosporioides (strain Cg-14) TaxID=1237896 RepID=T0KF79_COLGC|nr:hypothetical protein CGLO_08812 [Colletotrichum gloeosporioides Cg-14]
MALGVFELSLERFDDGWTPEKLGEKLHSGHLNAGLVANGVSTPELQITDTDSLSALRYYRLSHRDAAG